MSATKSIEASEYDNSQEEKILPTPLSGFFAW